MSGTSKSKWASIWERLMLAYGFLFAFVIIWVLTQNFFLASAAIPLGLISVLPVMPIMRASRKELCLRLLSTSKLVVWTCAAIMPTTFAVLACMHIYSSEFFAASMDIMLLGFSILSLLFPCHQ